MYGSAQCLQRIEIHPKSVSLPVRRLVLFLAALPVLADLRPETVAAFDQYARLQEQRMGDSLVLDRFPNLQDAIRKGDLVVKEFDDLDKVDPKAPHGQIHHWYGAMYLPGATVATARSVLADYPHYREYYAPDVTESRLLARRGDEYDAFLQLHKRYVIAVDLNTTYHIQFRTPNPNTLQVRSISTRITEGDKQPGDDQGFLWRLNSYWRFRQVQGGLLAECEAISLSRSTPLALQAMISGFLKKFPRDSMENTLAGTRRAIQARVR